MIPNPMKFTIIGTSTMMGQTWIVSALSLGFKKSFPLYELYLQVILRLALEFF